MSTRAQIILKDGHDKLWFYRHSDGYPEGTMPTLEKFLEWVKEGRIRSNVKQAAGWLVIIGYQEYLDGGEPTLAPHGTDGMGCKVGAYEPCCPVQHGDIAYLYTVDLEKKTITHKKIRN